MSSEIEKKLWERANKYVRVLQMVPFLKMAAVCNNLAFGKINEDSDVDLFIVAKEGRLFFVRSFVTFLFHILGVRRHGEKISQRFCLSFFMDDSDLNLSSIAIKDDVYLAFWIKSMVPLLDYNDTSNRFLEKNIWAGEYFESKSDFIITKNHILMDSKVLLGINKSLKWIFGGGIGNFIEKKLMNWQLERAVKKMRMERQAGGIIVNEHILKFHNIDRRREYRNLWNKKFGKDMKITDKRFLSL